LNRRQAVSTAAAEAAASVDPPASCSTIRRASSTSWGEGWAMLGRRGYGASAYPWAGLAGQAVPDPSRRRQIALRTELRESGFIRRGGRNAFGTCKFSTSLEDARPDRASRSFGRHLAATENQPRHDPGPRFYKRFETSHGR